MTNLLTELDKDIFVTDDFEKELIQTFFQEADINLEESEETYLQFSENTPNDLLSRSFRLAHNLKGSSKAVGFNDIAEILHHLESFLLKLKSKELNINNIVINLLLKTNDKLKIIIKELKKDIKFKSENKDLIEEINKISEDNLIEKNNSKSQTNEIIEIESKENDFGFFANEETKVENTNILRSEVGNIKIESNDVEKINIPENVSDVDLNFDFKRDINNKIKNKKETSDDIIRVPLNKIEKLQNYIGEIVIIQSMLSEQIKSDSNQMFKNYFRLLNKTTKEVQEIIMGLRLVSIKPVYQKLTRTARDTSAILNKKININFIGDDTEVDKFILDEISDPLMHMVRNAIDHGLESNDERKLKNKSLEGNITVKSFNDSGNLVLIVQDDGKGLNPKLIYESAVKKGVIKENDPLTDEQCLKLIFAPGFSTKSEATEISGRGVGMDVVKTNIESLNGTIDIISKIDIGTEFKIKIPLSVGIMDAFIIEVENEKYIIPVNKVVECLNFNKCNINHLTGMENVIILRDEEIPIIDLSLGISFKNAKNIKSTDKIVVIVHDNEKKVGVTVDKIIAIQSVVTKSLGDELRCETGIVGSVILGDGKVVPILEVSDLVKSSSFQKTLQRNKSRLSI